MDISQTKFHFETSSLRTKSKGLLILLALINLFRCKDFPFPGTTNHQNHIRYMAESILQRRSNGKEETVKCRLRVEKDAFLYRFNSNPILGVKFGSKG